MEIRNAHCRKILVATLALHLSVAALAVDPGEAGAATSFSGLQACSYDGSTLTVDPQAATGSSASGQEVVADIMRYTGLPQNFEVVAHPQVPNAAAMIVVGPDNLPKRVIAYNDSFMADVRQATANNNWAPISIMAHEIGHHLSGHTIQPGGSQPATELEADKFSGFVLYKMGAGQSDATKAINTLVPEEDGPTHPGRPKRVRAIEDGWLQACSQQSDDCSQTAGSPQVAVAAAPPPSEATPDSTVGAAEPVAVPSASRTETTGAPTGMAAGEPASAATTATIETGSPATASIGGGQPAAAHSRPDVLPVPDPQATPAKFGKFVIDELGLLDAGARAAFERQMFDLAAKRQVEIVTILARDLHGLDADAYARAMMRQLRVGKLDVGNGCVLVVAPQQKQVGVAMGPGILLEMRDYIDLEKDRLKNFIEFSMPYCKGTCSADQTETLFEAGRHIAHDVGAWDFGIAYQTLDELLAKFNETMQARMDGADISPDQDPTWRKVAKVKGVLKSRNLAGSGQEKWLNDVHQEQVGPPLYVVGENGRNLLIYADPGTETLMPGKLVEGQSYMFVVREASLSQNPEDTLSFDLLSFDAVQAR